MTKPLQSQTPAETAWVCRNWQAYWSQQVDDFLASQHEGGTTTCCVTRKGKTSVGKADKLKESWHAAIQKLRDKAG
jgi:hypothetical protein